MRNWVRMRSESTSALGQPRDTKPTFGLAGAGVVDMSNLGICDASSRDRQGDERALTSCLVNTLFLTSSKSSSESRDRTFCAPLIKKCAILAMRRALDQHYEGNATSAARSEERRVGKECRSR